MKKFRSFFLILIATCVFLSTQSVVEASPIPTSPVSELSKPLKFAKGINNKVNVSAAKVSDATVRLQSAIKKLDSHSGNVELTVFKPSGPENTYLTIAAVNEEGKQFTFDSKKNEYGMTIKWAKLPYGKYTLQAQNKQFFIYEPEIEVREASFSKDLYAYQRAKLKIVSHGYGEGEPKYSIYLKEMDSSWNYNRLIFSPELVPQEKGVKVQLTDYDKDNYFAKETEKTIDVKSDSAVIGFYFTKKQNVVSVSSFSKVKVPAKFNKTQVIKRLPATGKLVLEDGTEREVSLTWNTDTFVENKEETVWFSGKYPEQKDLKNAMEFRIEVERLEEGSAEILIESIDPIKPVDVKFGTTAEELLNLLPNKIRVKLSNSPDKKDIPVEWVLTGYEPEKPGTYTFKGKYSIEGVQDYLDVTVEVRLKEKELPLTEDDFKFTKKDGRVILQEIKQSGKNKVNKSKKLTVPATYKGEAVVEIGSTACQWLDFEELEIPNTVEIIGFKAFGYGRLTSLTIPDSVKQIEKSAFSARANEKEPRIKDVKMSRQVEKIDDSAFGWAGFTEIEVPTTLKELHKEAFYKAKGHPETKKVHVYVTGFTNPNQLKDGITHIINPSKVTFEYRYKGKLLEKSKASYKYNDKYYHINEEAIVKPSGIPSGYETKTADIRVIPNAKEYVHIVDLVKPDEKIVAKEVIHQFKDLKVPFGTDKDALKQKLPATVTVIDSQGTEHIVSVNWYWGSYDGNKPSVYKIRASFSLPEGVEQNPKNPVALEYWIKVTVNEEEMERSISIEFSFPGHVGVPELYAVDEFGKEYVFKHSGGQDQYSVKVPKGKFRVLVRNIQDGWVSVPSYLNVNTIKQNATGIISLEKGIQLKVKAVDEKGVEVPNVEFKTLVPVLDMTTWNTTEYEYGTLIPSSLNATDSVKIMIKEVPDGYQVAGEKQKVISFSKVKDEVVFKLQKIADLLEISQDGRFVRIRINQNGEGGNFVIRDSSECLVYVGVLEGTERSLSLHLEEEEGGEYFIYVNVDGVVKKKSISLQ